MTRDELIDDLGVAGEKVAAYFAALPLEELYRREGEAWAPVDDLRHLTLSLTTVTRGFRLPEAALEERFGRAEGPPRSRAEIGRIAMAGLQAGGKAPAGLSPEPVPPHERTEAFRTAVLEAWRAASRDFESAVAAWDEDALDRASLLHPFLGSFSLREWIHFNVLHGYHHMRVAERRLGRG
jgi:hypothetical protein